jgi:hypothetical protein
VELSQVERTICQNGIDLLDEHVHEDANQGNMGEFPSQHGCNVPARADVNTTRAFGIEVEAQQVSACVYRRKCIAQGPNSADFDFGHSF